MNLETILEPSQEGGARWYLLLLPTSVLGTENLTGYRLQGKIVCKGKGQTRR